MAALRYTGHIKVEALTIGAVVGLTFVSGLGLLVVAAAHYLGVARLVATTWLVPCFSMDVAGYPYFAQQLFTVPRDATGKIVCANCHLQAAPVEFTSPTTLYPGTTCEASIFIPARRSNAQIRSDGSLGPQQVGMALVLGEGIHVKAEGWSNWSNTVTDAVALGPVSSRANAAQTVALALDTIPVGTRSLYLGANRGRGQLYPDGSISNLSLRKTEVLGTCQAVTYLVKRYGSVVHIVHARGVWLAHLLPGQAVDPVIGPFMISQVESLMARTLNLGGFGLAEVALSVQVPANLKRFIGLMLLIQVTQLLLLNKKKQYERIFL